MENTMQTHKDPLEVHKENMKLLKVLPVSGNRSVPNSPMMRRAAERAGINRRHLSPSPHRKDLLRVTEENRSKSWTHLGDELSSNQSPKESPIGSPSLSISEKMIRTHFLSNTTGKAGSYLLRKSDEIIKKKSPSGSPRYPSSPSVARKEATVSSSATIGFHVNNPGSPAIAKKEQTGPNKSSRNLELHKQRATNFDDDSDSDSEDEVNQHLKDVRNSIGVVLSKTKSSEEIQTDAKTANSTSTSTPNPNASQIPEKEPIGRPTANKGTVKHKQKRHKYIVYGDTGLSPGYLTPPKESRGSIDLSAEMETWKRQERRKFEELDYVDEASTADSHDDSEQTHEAEKPEVPVGLYMIPPVSANIAHQPKVRDYSVAVETQEINHEDWDEMKRCRYLRIQDGDDDDIDDADLDDEDEKTSSDEENESETISYLLS